MGLEQKRPNASDRITPHARPLPFLLHWLRCWPVQDTRSSRCCLPPHVCCRGAQFAMAGASPVILHW